MGREAIDVLRERQLKESNIVIKEKAERLIKTMELKVPDRVPLGLATCGHILAKWFKLNEVYFDYNVMGDAAVKFASEYPCDLLFTATAAEGFIFSFALSNIPEIASTVRFLTGPMHDILRDKYTKWPGRELKENLPFQFLGGKFMEPEEYGKLIEDPVDFVVSIILPRACLNLEKPGTASYTQTLIRLVLEGRRYMDALGSINAKLLKIGYPTPTVTFAYSPLDIIGDFLRHPTHAMTDIYRYPDKVKTACEVIVKPILDVALSLKPIGANLAFIPLHLNEMLPPKLYNEFYWPYLKKIILELLNNGIKSLVFFEGDHTPHLDTILELPKGWGIGWFERPRDFMEVWRKLKGHTVVMGGVPLGLICGGPPEKIEEHVKKILEEVKPDGGFILAPGVADIPPETPEANIRALVNALLKYGVY